MNRCSNLLTPAFVLIFFGTPLTAQEVVVLSDLGEAIAWFKAENWRGTYKLRADIEAMHKPGEIDEIVERVRLE